MTLSMRSPVTRKLPLLLLFLVTTLSGTSHDHGQGLEKRFYQSPQPRSFTQPILSFLVLAPDGPRFANEPGASDAKTFKA